MSAKKYSFIIALPTAIALWAYFYTVSLTFRVVFLENSIGPLLLWHVPSPFSLIYLALFTLLLIAVFFSCLFLQRKKISLVPFTGFWHLALTPLILSPLSGKFPEFIPLALVLLPAASAAAFLVLIFHLPRTAGQELKNPGHQGEKTSSRQTVPSSRIFEPRLAPYTVWVITFFILLTSGLYVSERIGYKSGDVKYYFTIATSMHQDHDIDMTNNIKNYKPAPRYHISRYAQNGHAYSWHPVGLPLILAPFFNGAHDFREALIIMCIIGAFLASQMYLAAFEETGNAAISLLAWIALSFSSPLWFYSFRAWPFMPGGLCILYVWRRMRNFRDNSPCQIIILNLLLSWLLWLHDTFAVCYGILIIFLLCHRIRKLWNSKILITVTLQGLNLGVFFWFHYRWFGKHLFGQSGNLFTFWPGILGAWLDYCRGMAFIGPIHLLCLILIFVYAFSKRNLAGFTLLALYLYSFVIDTSSWHWVDPFNHPGRRLVEIIPLTCIPLGYFLKRKKTLSFYWLAAFLSLLSISYMLFFVLNPRGIDKPVRYLALSHQQFRTFCSNLPAFGKNFQNFPWTHVGAVTASLMLFILFWVLLLMRKKGERSPRFLFAGMWVTLLWTFVSAGWMKAHFNTHTVVPWNTNTNCVGKRNIAGISRPPLERGLYRYIVQDIDKTQKKLSWSVKIMKKLPTSLDLAGGMYRFSIRGTGKSLSTGTLTILELLEGKKLGNFPVHVDAGSKFFHEAEIDLSRKINRLSVRLASQDNDLIFCTMIITPIPDGLESLIAEIEQKGKPSGWIQVTAPQVPFL